MRWSILLVVALLSGCGSKDTSDGFETPQQEGGFYVIELGADKNFHPAKSEVPAGSIVSFHFQLPDCDVRSQEPGGPDSRERQYATGIYPQGERYNWEASSAQEFNIYCSKHASSMKGVLRVLGP